jgi:hypothetical protein
MPPSIAILMTGVRSAAEISRWSDLILIDYWSQAIDFQMATEMRKHCNIKLVCLKFERGPIPITSGNSARVVDQSDVGPRRRQSLT